MKSLGILCGSLCCISPSLIAKAADEPASASAVEGMVYLDSTLFYLRTLAALKPEDFAEDRREGFDAIKHQAVSMAFLVFLDRDAREEARKKKVRAFESVISKLLTGLSDDFIEKSIRAMLNDQGSLPDVYVPHYDKDHLEKDIRAFIELRPKR